MEDLIQSDRPTSRPVASSQSFASSSAVGSSPLRRPARPSFSPAQGPVFAARVAGASVGVGGLGVDAVRQISEAILRADQTQVSGYEKLARTMEGVSDAVRSMEETLSATMVRQVALLQAVNNNALSLMNHVGIPLGYQRSADTGRRVVEDLTSRPFDTVLDEDRFEVPLEPGEALAPEVPAPMQEGEEAMAEHEGRGGVVDDAVAG